MKKTEDEKVNQKSFKQTYEYEIHWIHLLAWHTLETSILDKSERKAIGIFISNYKNGNYISQKNTLLLKVTEIVDEHSDVKPSDMPEMKDRYEKKERMAINKGIRQLYKRFHNRQCRVWSFCERYLYCATGARNTRVPSANKLNFGKMTIAIHA